MQLFITNKQGRPPTLNRKPGTALPVCRNRDTFVRHGVAGKEQACKQAALSPLKTVLKRLPFLLPADAL